MTNIVEKSRRASKESESEELDISPESLFAKELTVVLRIAKQYEQSTGGRNIQEWTKKMDELQERIYIPQAKKEESEPGSVPLVYSAFYTLKAFKWGNSNARGSRLEKARNFVLAQQYTVQYVRGVFKQHRELEAKEKLATYWTAQERSLGKLFAASGISFEQYKNGILREVAVEHVIDDLPGWQIVDHEHPDIDAVQKIDTIIKNPNGSYIFLQLKEANKEDEQLYGRGFSMDPVTPLGQGEADPYLRKFQQGMAEYMHGHDIALDRGIGYKLALSANQRHMNKITGVPTDTVRTDLAVAFQQAGQFRS